MTTDINTYHPEKFRDKFMRPEQKLDIILKPDFDKLFIVKVEDLIRLMELPVPPSRVPNHTLIYLTNGDAEMKIGSSTYKIYQDDILIVQAGQVFSFENVDINNGYLCNFHNDILIGKFGSADLVKDFEFLKVWGNPFIRLNKQTSQFVLHILERIYFDYSENGLKNLDIIQPYLLTLLCEINRVYKPALAGNNTAKLDITKKFKELLFSNFKTKHLVSDYASILGVSPNHLNKCVKAVTGKSPTKWIDEAIILEAKVLLYQSNLSVSQISDELGYDEQSYFSRFFKKYEKITPLEFRNRIEKS